MRAASLGLGLALALQALAARADDASERTLGRELELLEASRLEDAKQIVDAEAARPGVGPLVAGAYDFYRGAYADAARAIDQALASGALTPRVAQEAQELRRLAHATDEVTHAFVARRSEHFEIRVAPGHDELLAEPALDALERALHEIGGDLGEAPPVPIRVEIYRGIADLAKVSPLTEKEIKSSGTIALCKFDRLMATSPGALVAGYPWLDTLAHELTHYLVNHHSQNTVPIWLHEGIAKLEERRWREPFGAALPPSLEHLLASGLRDGHLVTFAQMSPSMAKLPSQKEAGLAFAEVTTAVQYLVEARGLAGLRKLLVLLRGGATLDRALQQVTGQALAGFEARWRTWLAGRGLRTHPELGMPGLRFKRGDELSKEEDDFIAREPAGSPGEAKARGHVRLGTMMRTRGRLAAAAAEYELAVALLGAGNPQVAGRLGRTYLELKDWDRAIGAARPGIARQPDSAGLRVTVGRALLERGDAAGARPLLEGALAINPFDPQTRCGLARAYRAIADARASREAAACDRLGGAR